MAWRLKPETRASVRWAARVLLVGTWLAVLPAMYVLKRYIFPGTAMFRLLLAAGGLAALLTIVGALALRLLRQYQAGHCQSCGYDLTGNTSGVCPECGESV